MSPILKALCGGMIVLFAAGHAHAADSDLSPGYVGADFGNPVNFARNGNSGRVYAGYALGSTIAFDKPQMHYVELMAFSTGLKADGYQIWDGSVLYETVRANGVAINWTSELKLTDDWGLTTRLGVDYTQAKIHSPYGGFRKWEGYEPVVGVGGSYKLTERASATADLTYMPINIGRDLALRPVLLTAGVKYHF